MAFFHTTYDQFSSTTVLVHQFDFASHFPIIMKKYPRGKTRSIEGKSSFDSKALINMKLANIKNHFEANYEGDDLNHRVGWINRVLLIYRFIYLAFNLMPI